MVRGRTSSLFQNSPPTRIPAHKTRQCRLRIVDVDMRAGVAQGAWNMRTLVVVAALSVLSAASLARAQEQEPAAPAEQEQEQAEKAPRHIQVLQNPYEISSFYRSSQQSAVGFGYEPTTLSPYPIASFYRSQQTSGAYGM